MIKDYQRVAHVIRGLAADGVQRANSGHPGLPLGCAEIGTALFFQAMNHDPTCPNWVNRDRFVLSGGHGSMLLYSLLHLTGYDVTLDDLKSFRQLHSKTPGHPEFGHTVGVETTTGPLGQGVGNAVGMAIGEEMLAKRFNQPDFPLISHYTYCLLGDGDMMEGISGEAASLAGHLGLGKLILIYDSNNITIEGSTELAFTECVSTRFLSYGFHVQEVDGHDLASILAAIHIAKKTRDKPSLIIAKTEIAKGAPTKVGTSDSHGSPLGKEEIDGMKRDLQLPAEEFFVPDEVKVLQEELLEEGKAKRESWEQLFLEWQEAYPSLYQEWERGFSQTLEEDLPELFQQGEKIATRQASQRVLQVLADKIPYLIGGSADLAPSTLTHLKDKGMIAKQDFAGRNFNFGVREHAMGAILNGLSLYGYFRPFGATFLVFSDYLRPAIRLSALMNQPVIYIFTHDSVFVGEDGPTHQPIEQIESLRLIPRLRVFRPSDGEETAWSYLAILKEKSAPSALILTRQALTVMPKACPSDFYRGAYILKKEEHPHQITLLGSGSEVNLIFESANLLEQQGIGTRVVSVPCRERFLEQEASYKEELLPKKVPTLAVEMGIGSGWYQLADAVHALCDFGICGKGEEVAKQLGFTPEHVVTRAIGLLR